MERVTYVPGWSAIVTLRGVMPSLTMTTHDKNLVSGLVTAGVTVEMLDILGESLPLRFITFARILKIRRVCTVYKTKVPLRLFVVSVG